MADRLTKNGYVVYYDNWPGSDHSNAYWEKIRKTEEEKVRNLLAQIPDPNNEYLLRIGKNLINLGEREKQKELKLLQQALGEDLTDANEYELINKFNEVIQGKKRFERAVDQIKRAAANYKNGQKQMAPVLSSLYLSHLQHTLGEEINQFIKKYSDHIMNNDLSDWEREYNDILDRAIEQALKDLLQYTNKDKIKDIYGTDEPQIELLRYFETLSHEQNVLTDIIRKKINVNNIRNLIKTNLEAIQFKKANGKNMTGFGWAKKAVGAAKSRAGQVGGSVNEFINQLIQGASESFENYNRGARTLVSETLKTDNVLIFSLESIIDIEKIMVDLDEQLSKSADLTESARIMSDYYEKNLSKLDKSFVIFTSGKAYSVNSSENLSHGFQNDKKRSIEQLPEILSQGEYGMSILKAQDFIKVLMNTIPDAVLDDKRDDVQKTLRLLLMQSMAYLLFDDWIALGGEVGDTNAIHAFTLNNIQVPLSYLLINAGNAIQTTIQYSQWFRVTLNMPKSIKYYDYHDYPTIDDKPDVQAAWEEQRQEALDLSTFSTHFLSNFYTTLIKNLPV